MTGGERRSQPLPAMIRQPFLDENSRKIAKIVFATVIFLRNRRNIPTESTLMSAFEVKNVRKRVIGFDVSSVFFRRAPYGSLRAETGDWAGSKGAAAPIQGEII